MFIAKKGTPQRRRGLRVLGICRRDREAETTNQHGQSTNFTPCPVEHEATPAGFQILGRPERTSNMWKGLTLHQKIGGETRRSCNFALFVRQNQGR
jgi:hypothetical protein